jgi:uracil-DNA glycosylase family 4
MKPVGEGRKKILIVGEAPGAEEDDKGEAFVGKAGRKLREVFDEVGIDLRKDCLITNSLICRPPSNKTPDSRKISYCRANLINTIRDFDPTVIVPLGGVAVESVLGYYYKDSDIGGIMRWQGWQIPHQKANLWICPTYHPAYLGYTNHPVADMRFLRDLKAIASINRRPWAKPPNWPARVQAIIDSRAAADAIHAMLERGAVPIAPDFETTCIKPPFAHSGNTPNGGIVSCSLSDGETTIAYPWVGEAIDATYEVFRSDRPKIGANIKFEEQWANWQFGRGIRNWVWDVVVNAHLIDNRPNISSVKFQSFALLGVEPYETDVKDMLKARKGSKQNRIRQADIMKVLAYNGMDSLVEWKIGHIQASRLGIKL